jgi:hypothetical protein
MPTMLLQELRNKRTREKGIRRAMGAGAAGIVASVSQRSLRQVGIGLAIGNALAVPWSALLARPELQTRSHDPLVFGAAGAGGGRAARQLRAAAPRAARRPDHGPRHD